MQIFYQVFSDYFLFGNKKVTSGRFLTPRGCFFKGLFFISNPALETHPCSPGGFNLIFPPFNPTVMAKSNQNRLIHSLSNAGISPHVIAQFLKRSIAALKKNKQGAKAQFEIAQAKLLLFHLCP